MLFKIENLLHMQLVISLSFVKLLRSFVRYILYSHDQDHIHSTYICQLLHRKLRKNISSIQTYHPTNKTPCYSWLPSPSYHFKKEDMGYAKRNKRHAQERMMKKNDGRMKVQLFKRKLDTWRSKYSKKKEKKEEIAHVQRKWREVVHERSSYTIHTKIFTHMHILIKVYDLFLLRIRSLT